MNVKPPTDHVLIVLFGSVPVLMLLGSIYLTLHGKEMPKDAWYLAGLCVAGLLNAPGSRTLAQEQIKAETSANTVPSTLLPMANTTPGSPAERTIP